jgi:PEGA domain-containing protein
MRAFVAGIVVLCAVAAHAEEKRTVAVLEYRAGARGARDIGLRLARLLRDTSALNVIDLQEARRKLPKVDGEVAKCGGEAMCVGAIGEQLGANEVLLVGVSQLGDVIIAIQRIDAKRGEAGARLAESLPQDKEITDEQALGWLRQLFPPETFRRFGSIAVDADVAGAEVTLNGEPAGKTPLAEPVKVRAPATYKLRVEKSGFVPFQARVDVLPDANVEVHATLVRESKEAPWYKRWYVWATVGGAVAIGAVATAVYFGTRTDTTPLGYVQRPPSGPAMTARPFLP